jgi:hypothetical protein
MLSAVVLLGACLEETLNITYSRWGTAFRKVKHLFKTFIFIEIDTNKKVFCLQRVFFCQLL